MTVLREARDLLRESTWSDIWVVAPIAVVAIAMGEFFGLSRTSSATVGGALLFLLPLVYATYRVARWWWERRTDR